MKRDLDLVRKIIVALENKANDYDLDQPEIKGSSRELISYHIGLLAQAGYLEAIDFPGNDRHNWFAKTLTWEGHEFADLLRSESLWNQAKEKIGQAAGTITLEALKFVLTEAINGRLAQYFTF